MAPVKPGRFMFDPGEHRSSQKSPRPQPKEAGGSPRHSRQYAVSLGKRRHHSRRRFAGGYLFRGRSNMGCPPNFSAGGGK